MRLVLDTNVIISAFLSTAGKPSQILKMVLSRRFGFCYNSAILGEYETVMFRPKFYGKINLQSISRFLDLLRTIGISYSPLPGYGHPKIAMPDESDRIFYETALGSGSLLITGNTKHYPKKPFIMIPAEFLSRYG